MRARRAVCGGRTPMYCTLERMAPSARQARRWLRRYAACAHATWTRRRVGVRSFCDHLPQYLLVQGEVRDQLLQLPILFAELAELAYFGRAEVPKLLLPAVIRLLADLVLPAELGDGHAALPLPEDVYHLLRRELARPHPRRAPVLVGDPKRLFTRGAVAQASGARPDQDRGRP